MSECKKSIRETQIQWQVLLTLSHILCLDKHPWNFGLSVLILASYCLANCLQMFSRTHCILAFSVFVLKVLLLCHILCHRDYNSRWIDFDGCCCCVLGSICVEWLLRGILKSALSLILAFCVSTLKVLLLYCILASCVPVLKVLLLCHPCHHRHHKKYSSAKKELTWCSKRCLQAHTCGGEWLVKVFL
jgi:hypothetical protein